MTDADKRRELIALRSIAAKMAKVLEDLIDDAERMESHDENYVDVEPARSALTAWFIHTTLVKL